MAEWAYQEAFSPPRVKAMRMSKTAKSILVDPKRLFVADASLAMDVLIAACAAKEPA